MNYGKFIDSDNLNHISNIHLKIISHESYLIEQMKSIKYDNRKDASKIYEQFDILNEFYEKY
jgi:hypothetical protein